MAGTREAKKLENTQRLIDATIESIAEHGLRETTISSVVERVGLSRGMVSLRFDSKEALLTETLRYLANEWHHAWKGAFDDAGNDPADQLLGVLLAVFDPPVFSRKRLSVWHAFWADSKHRIIYRNVCGGFDRDYRATLESLCLQLAARRSSLHHDPMLMADSLSALINGLWLDLLTIPRTVNKERAREMCILTLCHFFPDDYSNVAPVAKRAS